MNKQGQNETYISNYDIVPGDCGSWVVDANTGNLVGHIVAGDSTLHRAYLIQATDVFHDIQSTNDMHVFLPTQLLLQPPGKYISINGLKYGRFINSNSNRRPPNVT
jgi:hypothetical protein